MEIATQAFASALLDGREQIARTTSTSVPLPIAAMAHAKTLSTTSRASAMLDGREMTAQTTSMSVPLPCAATVHAQMETTRTRVSALLVGREQIARTTSTSVPLLFVESAAIAQMVSTASNASVLMDTRVPIVK